MIRSIQRAFVLVALCGASSGTALANENSRVSFTLAPEEAVFDQARWRINDTLPLPDVDDPLPPNDQPSTIENPLPPQTWLKSGEVMRQVPDGLHVVEFIDVGATVPTSPCKHPAPQRIHVRANALVSGEARYDCSQQTASISPGSVQEPGLTVTLGPQAAIAGGARWRFHKPVSQEESWRMSGDTVAAPGDGTHVLEFKPVTSGPCAATPKDVALDWYQGQTIKWEVRYAGEGC